jgi:hypothetical protein
MSAWSPNLPRPYLNKNLAVHRGEEESLRKIAVEQPRSQKTRNYTMTNSADLIAITDVVRTYATAMTAGDSTELERIFFENSCEVGHYEGELLWNSRDEFIRMCEDEADSSATPWWEIRNISIHGDIAVVHVEDVWAGMHFDTILTLLLHENAWRVTAKAYRIKPS